MKFQRLLVFFFAFIVTVISLGATTQIPSPDTDAPKLNKPQNIKPGIVTTPAQPALNIVLVGIQDPAQKNVRNTLQHLQNQLQYPLTSGMVQLFTRKAPNEIRTALEPYGFFKAKIRQQTTYQNGIWTVTFFIDPGPAIKITALDIKVTGPGATDPAFMRVLRNMPLHIGHPLNIDLYNQAKQNFIETASQRGFFDAQMIENKIIINLLTYQVQIILHFETGNRYRFGATTFSKTDLAIPFLERFLRYHEGEYYDYHLIQNTQLDFLKSNYFAMATITPMPQLATHYAVPINIHLLLRKKYQYSIGAGYGTDTGIRGILGFAVRRLNDYGHRFNAIIQASRINSSLLATYSIPGRHPATDQYTIGAGVANMNENIGTSNSQKLSLSYTKGLGDNVLQTIALTYLNEQYNLITLPNPIQTINAMLLYPSISWQFLYTDNPIKPANAIVMDSQFAGTPDALTENKRSGFSQIRANAKVLMTLGTATRFLVRGSVGETVINNIQNLPLSLQLLAGGADSVRGFGYDSIGPGHTLVVGSFEVQEKIKKNWYIAGFIDTGSVSNNLPWDTLNVGVGPGLVWLSPIGTLEISLGYPIKVYNQPKEWVFEFSMGPAI